MDYIMNFQFVHNLFIRAFIVHPSCKGFSYTQKKAALRSEFPLSEDAASLQQAL